MIPWSRENCDRGQGQRHWIEGQAITLISPPFSTIQPSPAKVQNPDRRSSNPNLWSRSERLGVYDHEQAFSFLHLPIIGGPSRPWVLADQAASFRFMEKHAFYPALRGARLNLGPFREKLVALSDRVIEGLLNPIPAEWRQGHDLCSQTAEYLREAREERTAFLNFVKHLLR